MILTTTKLLVCGVINWDVTLFVDRFPNVGEEVQVKKSIAVPGGKGGNTAVAAARILGSGKVAMIGMLGSDEVESRQIKFLKQEGVDTTCITRHERASSGTAYLIVDSRGEDMILTHFGANGNLSENLRSYTFDYLLKLFISFQLHVFHQGFNFIIAIHRVIKLLFLKSQRQC